MSLARALKVGQKALVITWVITRAIAEAASLVEQLNGAGLRAVAVPCIERSPLPFAPWRPDGHRVVLLTSVAAAERVAPVLQASLPADIATLAPVTAQSPALVSFAPSIASSQGVAGLAQAIADSLRMRSIERASFWYPTSAVALESSEHLVAIERLSSFGPVARVPVYQTVSPMRLVEDLRLFSGEVGVYFASPSAVTNFVAAQRSLGDRALSPRMIACWGSSTHREAEAHFHGVPVYLVPRTAPISQSLHHLETTAHA